MKKTLLLTILFCFLHFSNAQESVSDSLKTLSQKAGKYAWINKDSAYHYFNKIKTLTRAQKKWDALAENYINNIRSAAYFSRKELDLQTISLNLDELETLFKKQQDYFSKHQNFSFYKNCLLNDRASYYFQLDDYSLAQNNFDALIDNILSNDIKTITPEAVDLLSSAYIYKAKMYSDEGKYELSKIYFDRNIRLLLDLKPENKKSLFTNYSLLGELFKRLEDYKKSNNYFIPSLKYKLQTNGKKNGIITDAQNIIGNYIELKQIDSAKIYLKIIKDNLTENNTYLSRYYDAKAKLFKAVNNYDDAIKEEQKILEVSKENWNTKKHLEVAQAYSALALTQSEINKNTKALNYYNLAINELTNKKVNSTLNNTELLKLYNYKTSILLKQKNSNQVLTTANIAIELLDSLKPSFKTETDKLFIVNQAYPIFENGLEATYNLYAENKDNTLINKAFYITEKSKSTLLLEALLSAKATNFKTIPDSLLVKEKELKSQINFFEKKIDRSKTVLNDIENKLFNIKKKYSEVINIIETNYKSYYDLKYNSKVASIKDVQAFLKKDDVLLSYFYGENSLYAISITKNEKHFSRVTLNDATDNLIKDLYALLNNPKSNLQQLHHKSFELFNLIVKPNISFEHKKNLVLLTDGLLNYIPFAALSTNKSNYNYLIEDYAISYANSATLLLQLQDKKENNDYVLAFAPSFNNSNLLALPSNKKEAQNVLSHFSGDLFSNDNATLNNFNKNNSVYSILHLATHAIYDDKTPEYSYLAFTSEENNEHSLYVRDLYNLELNADLVTLSACESGIGKLNRGEGLMSLARGFYFSGANSIASTLWKVNDASSTKLMDGFYKALAEKENKNSALKTAQLNFIKKNRDNKLSHPYYWSGFIISGNTNAINNQSFLLYIFGSILIVLLLYFYFKRKNA